MTTDALKRARETEVTAPAPVKDKSGNFLIEAVFQTWRAVSRNENFTGETETFGFSNGEAVIPAIPRSARCTLEAEVCERRGQECRMHDRIRHLNNLANYPRYDYVRTRQGVKANESNTYRVLSEDEYDAEYGQRVKQDALFDEDIVDEEL